MSERHPAEETRELIDAWNRGDRSAFDALIERSRSGISRRLSLIAGRAPGQTDDVDDLMQKVLTVAWRRFPEFEYRFRGSFDAWLKSIADFVVREFLDRRRIRLRKIQRIDDVAATDLPKASTTPSESANRAEAARAILDGMSVLSNDDQALVSARIIDGHSIATIAALQGISKTEAFRRLRQAMAKLRRGL